MNEARIANGYSGLAVAGDALKMPDGSLMPISQLEAHVNLQVQAAQQGLKNAAAAEPIPQVAAPKPSAAVPSDTKPPKVPAKATVRIVEDEIETRL